VLDATTLGLAAQVWLASILSVPFNPGDSFMVAFCPSMPFVKYSQNSKQVTVKVTPSPAGVRRSIRQ
jgi:hypothetical protein